MNAPEERNPSKGEEQASPGASIEKPRITPQLVYRIVKQSIRDMMFDESPQWAAAIAYYALLSAFPLILGIVSIASFFVQSDWAVEQVTAWLGEFVPRTGEVERIVREAVEARGGAGVFSILFLLWSGSRVFATATIALNIAYDVEERYGFLKRTMIQLIMVIGIGSLLALALLYRPALWVLASVFEIDSADRWIASPLGSSVISGTILLVVFFLTYYYVPRLKVDWRAALVGAIVSTVLFSLGRPLFLTYLRDVASLTLVYGSIAAIIILVLWAWIAAIIFLFGGEIASHIQVMAIEGETPERVEERHRERSPTRRTKKRTHPRALEDP